MPAVTLTAGIPPNYILAKVNNKQYRKDTKHKRWVEGEIMDWTWSSPVAVGLFAVLAGFTLVLFAAAIAIVSGKAKVSDLPSIAFWR